MTACGPANRCFMTGQIEVPDDFDTRGSPKITQLFCNDA